MLISADWPAARAIMSSRKVLELLLAGWSQASGQVSEPRVQRRAPSAGPAGRVREPGACVSSNLQRKQPVERP